MGNWLITVSDYFLNNVLSCHVAISDFCLFKRSLAAYLVTISICPLNKIICAKC